MPSGEEAGGAVAGAGLRLEVRDYTDPANWRWVLTDDGNAVAEHTVKLDERDWQFDAFRDLPGWISWHAAPDRYREDEARMVAEVGDWIGSRVLGPIAPALASRRPATVHVVLPTGASDLAFLPLELAHANNKPLAVQGVTLVTQLGPEDGRNPDPVAGRLRVLGLFSLPEGGQALNLRRERHALVDLIRGINATGKAADVRVLQYGVTRASLQDVLAEGEGWDVVHISGHGAPGTLVLETAEGTPDPIDAATLATMLEAAQGRLKLVTVAACWSAGLTTAEQRRLLGLPTDRQESHPERDRPISSATSSGALATELSERLGCAVLAMRYPVNDDFAIALSEHLYDLLADKGQALPQALGLALRRLSRQGDGTAPNTVETSPTAFPALSLATPALFGGRAIGLRLAAPERDTPGSYDTATLKLPGFPPEPERFVGRTRVMTRASAALASKSRIPGVLLHGMPGGGKTACALELAYNHEHAFDRLVWYKAPDDGMDISGALTDFAFTLERYLPGFHMIDAVSTADKLAGFLPGLTELMERRRLLIVIDNAESLLTDGGQWRDDRWGQVTGALTRHNGLGRLVLTSRRVPAGLAGLRVESVDALSPDEALLLARELPHLKALIYDELPGIDREVSRQLALGVLNVAQGHPKLLELANGQAAHPERLSALVAVGDQTWRDHGGLPDGFFSAEPASTPNATAVENPTATENPTAAGDTSAAQRTVDAADYWHVLAAWTETVADTLSPGERDLFWFLCCLEEDDRQRAVLQDNWDDLRSRLGRDGQPPDLDPALRAIASRGLITIQDASDDTVEAYAIHPGIAEAARDQAGQPFRDAVDTEAAAFWAAAHEQASGEAGDGRVDTGLLVRAGLAAVPYLLRQHQWDQAGYLLQTAFIQDPTRANAAAVLPAIQQITRHQPRWAHTLGSVLAVTDPAAADATLRTAMTDAATRGDYEDAAIAAGRLVDLCRDRGRLAEALDLAGQKAGYARQAGLGPWTQLYDEVRRLQVLAMMGHARQVLDEATRLRDHMATLPATRGPNETIPPWDVREALLDTGRQAARLLGQHADALALNAEVVASKRGRRDPATDIARARFNDYHPLLRLGRTEEALAVLLDCRQVFQDAHDTGMLGMTLGALADTEDERGHGDAALRLQCDALRYSYLAGDVDGIAVSYHNLGNYLHRHARQPAPALASRLTAALISTLAGDGLANDSTLAAATDLRESGTAAVPPANVADLCRILGDIPGTNLPGLLAALSPDAGTAERTLRDLIAQAQELAAVPPAEASPDPA
jgi:CHAT domain